MVVGFIAPLCKGSGWTGEKHLKTYFDNFSFVSVVLFRGPGTMSVESGPESEIAFRQCQHVIDPTDRVRNL